MQRTWTRGRGSRAGLEVGMVYPGPVYIVDCVGKGSGQVRGALSWWHNPRQGQEVSQGGERQQSLPLRRRHLGLSFPICKTGCILTFLYIAATLFSWQRPEVPPALTVPQESCGFSFKRPPQICPGQPCQEKCLLCARATLCGRQAALMYWAPLSEAAHQ